MKIEVVLLLLLVCSASEAQTGRDADSEDVLVPLGGLVASLAQHKEEMRALERENQGTATDHQPGG